MCDWVIKITSKNSKGVIIYWCMKDTKGESYSLIANNQNRFREHYVW